MSLKRAIANLLDRSGGRSLLGLLATRVARRHTGADVRIFYDKLWVHQVEGTIIPDGRAFTYHAGMFRHWPDEVSQHLANARDWWFQHYTPQPGHVIVDIGAGRGEDVLAFSRAVGPTGRVLAIEAHPGTFELLHHFCRLNNLANVTPLHVAVLDKPGTVTITETEAWEANTVMSGHNESGIRVPAITLKAICDQENVVNIDFVKMNIEGAEKAAIIGMDEMIDNVRTICVACHDFRADSGDGEHFRTRRVVEDYLSSKGFRLFSRPSHSVPYVRDHIFGVRV